eukprot:1200906-Pyramimonas_sp.AAC.1
MITGWRLNQSGIQWCDSLKDLSNAFASPTWNSLDQACHALAQPRGRVLCRQRYRTSGCMLPSSDGPLAVKPGCGALQGDPFA